MTNNAHEPAWLIAWRNLLALCTTRLFLLDLDGTVWDDLLVILNEAFGPIDASTGEKKWKQYDRAFKVLNTMTNGAHLEAEYRDLFTEKTLAEIHAWLKANHRLIPGIKAFLRLLAENKITAIAITNGGIEIAGEMLKHHGLEMPVMSNSLVFEGGKFVRMDFLHDENVGIDKGRLVVAAREFGYEIVGCAGDSKGDITLAEETARAGGIIVAVGTHGLSAWLAENEGNGLITSHNWLSVSDYADASEAVTSRFQAG